MRESLHETLWEYDFSRHLKKLGGTNRGEQNEKKNGSHMAKKSTEERYDKVAVPERIISRLRCHVCVALVIVYFVPEHRSRPCWRLRKCHNSLNRPKRREKRWERYGLHEKFTYFFGSWSRSSFLCCGRMVSVRCDLSLIHSVGPAISSGKLNCEESDRLSHLISCCCPLLAWTSKMSLQKPSTRPTEHFFQHYNFPSGILLDTTVVCHQSPGEF